VSSFLEPEPGKPQGDPESSLFDNSNKNHASADSPIWHIGWNSDANPSFSRELPVLEAGWDEAPARKNVVVPRRLEKQAP
jgi:hypothetical protein